MVADYNNVHKDKCLEEFLKLRECVRSGRVSSFIPVGWLVGWRGGVGLIWARRRGRWRYFIGGERSLFYYGMIPIYMLCRYAALRGNRDSTQPNLSEQADQNIRRKSMYTQKKNSTPLLPSLFL